MDMFRNDEIDAVYLMYNEFKSVATQKLAVAPVLPAELPAAGLAGGLHF